jgi:hypothetical protein
MSIYTRQYQKVLAAELLRHLLLGKLPDINEMSRSLDAALDKNGNVTYRYTPQAFKSIFNNEIYNKAMKAIKFDIEVFHEDLIDMFSNSVSRVNFADLFHKVNSYELNKLQAQLELLLFTVKDADFYFDGAFDTFSDQSKTDMAASTKDILDLSEECIALPFGAKNVQRIDVKDLVSQNTVGIIPSNPSIILSNNPIPNTKFGNLFTDTLSVWGQEIITSTNAPLSISFSFPLRISPNIESELFVSRFEITPHETDPQNITISTSNDDVNYISILGYEQGIDLIDQKKTYAMDFETTLVQYVRVTLTKSEADEEILDGSTKKYKYIFGLKRFAAFQTGRYNQATYYSNTFNFGTSDVINKVSIDADQFIPPGCSISYAIAGVNSAGGVTSYIPISPIGTDSGVGTNKVVTFSSILEKKNKFIVPTTGTDSPAVYGTSFQGKDFYRIGPTFSSTPIFGRSRLYRGFKSWYRDTSGKFEIVNINDNYLDFATSPSSSVYTVTTEIPQVTALGTSASDGASRTKLTLTKPPYFMTSKGHSPYPPAGEDPFLDPQPKFAVYKIQIKEISTRQTRQFALGQNRLQYLPFSTFILQGAAADLPILRFYPSGVPLINGVDITYETETIGGVVKPTGRINIPDGSSLLGSNNTVLPGITLEFVYTVDTDITSRIESILGNDIVLKHTILSELDGIQVTYRYVPGRPDQILKSSIQVYNSLNPSNRIFYKEGVDFIVNESIGVIQKVPTGRIGDIAYIKYSYRSSDSSLNTFTMWAYVSGDSGTQIKFDLDPSSKKNRLQVDSAAGEAFYVNTKNGIVNLTNSSSTPVMSQGWVQFIVRSLDPTRNVAFRSNLIDQVIQMKDVNKKKIFNAFNFYFNELTAFREPMVEKTLNHLKVNTLLNDHSSFAIDSITDPLNSYLVLNFKPNETTELYSKVPTADADESSPPSSSNEEFLLEWSEQPLSDSRPVGIKVKIGLVREPNSDGSLTPKVFKYNLRVGS